MGQLRNKRVEYIRAWIDPTSPESPIPSLDYDYIYPVTVYEAVQRSLQDSVTLEDEISAIYRMIADKQDIVEATNVGSLMVWSNTKGHIGDMPLAKTIATDASDRSHNKVPTERAVGLALDLKVDASSYNNHVRNANIHITESERDIWNSMTPLSSFREHSEDDTIHITNDERVYWNAKADQSDFSDHITNFNNPHAVTAHQTGAYTRKEIDDMFESMRTSFFNYRNIEYDDRNNTATLVQYNDTGWNPNYILNYGDSLPEVTDQRLTYFALKPATDYSSNESQDCIIYIKRPGSNWQECGLETMEPGDLIIRYPDSSMFVWMSGRFTTPFSNGESGTAIDGSSALWKPVLSESGVLTFVLSTDSNPPDPMMIIGPAGHTPIKGVDYFDGMAGIGVPTGGNSGDIIVKSAGEDYETEWVSFGDYINNYFEDGLPEGIINWNNIGNKPTLYQTFGDDESGIVSQKAITEKFNEVNQAIENALSGFGSTGGIGGISSELNSHIEDYNNPHRITPEKIGAVTNTAFMDHTQDFTNPHNVTAEQVGLGNVDNTSDMDKPISRATLDALNVLDQKISQIVQNDENIVNNVQWDESTCTIKFSFRDGTDMDLKLPILEIFDTMEYDSINNELVLTLPNGTQNRIPVDSLITTYLGGRTDNIQVTIENGTIKAEILDGSITGTQIADSVHLRNSPTTTTQIPADTSHKIATTKFVKDVVIDRLNSSEVDRPLSANMGRVLNETKVSLSEVLELLADTPLANIVDNLTTEDSFAALSANMGRELKLTTAPKVHTSTSGSTYGRASADVFGHARAGSIDPLMDGIPFKGTDNGYYARADHRHGTDVSRAPVNFPDVENGIYRLTGEPRSVEPPYNSNDDRIATTGWAMRKIAAIAGVAEGVDFSGYVTGEWVINTINESHELMSDEYIVDKVTAAFNSVIGGD